MGKVQFRVSTRWTGRFRTLQICVYDNVREMRKAGQRHSKKHETGETGFDKAWGLVQTFDWYSVTERGKVRRHPPAGYIRLVQGHLGSGLLAHECTHAAVALYRQDIQRTIPDMEREEKLCYLVGDIMSKVVKKLYALGMYDA